MVRDMIASRSTAFIPRRDGYHFSNTNIRWDFNGASGTALCGGMAYSSLDFFHARMTIPGDTTPPAPGTILNEYIQSRQIDAHGFAIPRLFAGLLRDHSALFLTGVRMSESFGAVVGQIDRNQSVPILLVAVDKPLSTNSHWVVAIGYEMDEAPPDYGGRKCGRVKVYDSNHPDVDCFLTPDPQLNRFAHSRGGTYRTYIPNPNYRPVNLRQPRYSPLTGLRYQPTTRQSSTPFF